MILFTHESGKLKALSLDESDFRIHEDRIEFSNGDAWKGRNLGKHLLGDVLFMTVDPSLKELNAMEPMYVKASQQYDPQLQDAKDALLGKLDGTLEEVSELLNSLRQSRKSGNYQEFLQLVKDNDIEGLRDKLNSLAGKKIFHVQLNDSYLGAFTQVVRFTSQERSVKVLCAYDTMSEPSLISGPLAKKLGLNTAVLEPAMLMGVGDARGHSCKLNLSLKNVKVSDEIIIWEPLHERTGYHALLGQKFINYMKKMKVNVLER